MAEADVAIQALGAEQEADVRQARKLMEESTAEFDKQNYAGALYLANAAKAAAAQSRLRLGAVDRASLRQGEVLFAMAINLVASGRGNIREGPGTNFPVLFTAETGNDLTAVSYLGDWVRVSDAEGRSGWISRMLVNPRDDSR